MIDEQNYRLKLKGLCLIEISGEGCANCYSMLPVLRNLAAHMPQLTLVHVPAEEAAYLVEKWKVSRVPAIFLAENGEPFAKCSGYQPEEILELWIEAKLEEHAKKQ